MPVALNEPLNFLQRVSEELEYSELLDIANRTDDLYERMVKTTLGLLACLTDTGCPKDDMFLTFTFSHEGLRDKY